MAAALLAVAACGNDDPDESSSAPARTTVAFEAPISLRVDDVAEGGRPRIAAGRAGTWIMVYGTGDTIVALRSIDGGATWDSRVRLDSGPNVTTPELACDRAGACVATWLARVVDGEVEVDGIAAARSLDDGATWSVPARVSEPGVQSHTPGVATDGRGTFVVVWDSGFPPNVRPAIHSARLGDGGATWDAPVALSALDEFAFQPEIAADATGRWLAIWTTVDPSFPTYAARVVSTVSTDAGRTWSAPLPVTPAPTLETPATIGQGLTTDGVGTWIVTGVAERGDGGDGRFHEVFSVRSIDGGATWIDRAQLDTPGASTVDFLVRSAADAGGHVVVGWLTSPQANRLVVMEAQSVDRGVSWDPPRVLARDLDPFLDGLPNLSIATDDRGAWALVHALGVPNRASIVGPYDVAVARGALTED